MHIKCTDIEDPGADKGVHMNLQRALDVNRIIISIFLVNFLTISIAAAQKVGYDENTEIAVKGVVQKEVAHPYKGLSNFFLKTQWRIFRVLTAPSWYIKETAISLKKGQEVEVVGSKFYGPDGSLCLVAKSIRLLPEGKVIRFRDDLARPVWSDYVEKKNSCMKIFLRQGKSF